MTAREFVSDLALLGPQELHIVFGFLADHLHELRTRNGALLRDVADVIALLRELAELMKT